MLPVLSNQRSHIPMCCLKTCLVYLSVPCFVSVMLEQTHFLQRLLKKACGLHKHKLAGPSLGSAWYLLLWPNNYVHSTGEREVYSPSAVISGLDSTDRRAAKGFLNQHCSVTIIKDVYNFTITHLIATPLRSDYTKILSSLSYPAVTLFNDPQIPGFCTNAEKWQKPGISLGTNAAESSKAQFSNHMLQLKRGRISCQ